MTSFNTAPQQPTGDPRLAEIWQRLKRVRESGEEAQAAKASILKRRNALELLSQVDYLLGKRIAQGKSAEARQYREQTALLEKELGFHPE